MAGWVERTGSLTARMRRRCGPDFAVQVFSEGWRRPALDEAVRLDLDRRRVAWVREVALCCGSRPLIMARSVIPADSLRGSNRALRRLGTRPLGELLFAGAGTARDPLETARLERRHWLARRLVPDAVSSSETLWARRTVHWLQGRPLLVAEVFLPELVEESDG